MDKLIQELNQLRIARDEVSREYQRTLSESSIRERTLLASIEQRRQTDARTANNARGNRRNPFRVGDIVRIANDYSIDEQGVVGRVTHVTTRMVELQTIDARKLCKRAWWNVEKSQNTENAQ